MELVIKPGIMVYMYMMLREEQVYPHSLCLQYRLGSTLYCTLHHMEESFLIVDNIQHSNDHSDYRY